MSKLLRIPFLLLVALLLRLPVLGNTYLAGQETGTSSLRIGGGLTRPGDHQGEWGVHALGAGRAMGRGHFGFRGDFWVGGGDFFGDGASVLFGAAIGPLLIWTMSDLGWYASFGVGYNRGEPENAPPKSSGLGLSYVVGIEKHLGERHWFLEISPRIWGNVFEDYARTIWLVPITLGVRR